MKLRRVEPRRRWRSLGWGDGVGFIDRDRGDGCRVTIAAAERVRVGYRPGVLVGEDRPTSGLPGALVALGVVLLVLALVAGLLIRRGLWILGWRARAAAVAAPSASSTSATTSEPTRELRNGDDMSTQR
jgi:hypothetical protein